MPRAGLAAAGPARAQSGSRTAGCTGPPFLTSQMGRCLCSSGDRVTKCLASPLAQQVLKRLCPCQSQHRETTDPSCCVITQAANLSGTRTRGPLCRAACCGPAEHLQTLKGEPAGQRGGREGQDTGTRCTYPRAPSPPPCRAPANGPGRRPAGCPPGGRCSGPCSALPTSSSAAAAARAPRRPASPCRAAQGQVRVAAQSVPPAQHPGSLARAPSREGGWLRGRPPPAPAPPRAPAPPVPALAAGLAGTRRVRGQRLGAQSQPPAAGLRLGPTRGRVQEEVLSLLGGENTAAPVRGSAPTAANAFQKTRKTAPRSRDRCDVGNAFSGTAVCCLLTGAAYPRGAVTGFFCPLTKANSTPAS